MGGEGQGKNSPPLTPHRWWALNPPCIPRGVRAMLVLRCSPYDKKGAHGSWLRR
jgi:hypothetical protein